MKLKPVEIWFVTGSQNLYGPETLKQVAEDSTKMVEALNASARIPLSLVFKPVLKTPEEIRQLCLDANHAPQCAGLILWMHTFSPSKMWIGGLSQLKKPFLHLHTQFNRDLPWSTIDMDFMNLNQAAHGDREAGFIHTRLRLNRKVVVGHWSDEEVQDRIAAWMRVTRAWADWQGGKFARFGDNMRYVAVTDGDKVTAEARFGFPSTAMASAISCNTSTGRATRRWMRFARNTSSAIALRRHCARAARGMNRCATARARNWVCARFWKPETLPDSPRRSRICTGSNSFPVSPFNGSWPTATASARKATGRRAPCCVP